ncbi:MAG: hypothetical protein WC812_02600 [Candidatus Pacearchaeota archaeon]|jgi:hypothetical protein
MEFEKWKLEIAFIHISYLIENKTPIIVGNSKEYLKTTKEYFESANKSLESMINFDESKGYFITPFLKSMVISSLNKNPNESSNQEIIKVKSKVEKILQNLDKLEDNPLGFCNTKDSKKMLEYFKKFNSFLTKPIKVSEYD